MEIPVYNIHDLAALSKGGTSIGMKRQGRGTHFIDFNAYPIEPHSLYFLSPGQVHEWKLTDDVTGYIIAFTNEFFSHSIQDRSILSELPYFYTVNTQPLLHVDDEQATTFNDIIQKIEREYQASLVDREDMLCAYLRILLIEAKRIYYPTQTTHIASAGVPYLQPQPTISGKQTQLKSECAPRMDNL